MTCDCTHPPQSHSGNHGCRSRNCTCGRQVTVWDTTTIRAAPVPCSQPIARYGLCTFHASERDRLLLRRPA